MAAPSLQDIADTIAKQFPGDLRSFAKGRDRELRDHVAAAVNAYVEGLPSHIAYFMVAVDPRKPERKDVNLSIAKEVLALLVEMGR